MRTGQCILWRPCESHRGMAGGRGAEFAARGADDQRSGEGGAGVGGGAFRLLHLCNMTEPLRVGLRMGW